MTPTEKKEVQKKELRAVALGVGFGTILASTFIDIFSEKGLDKKLYSRVMLVGGILLIGSAILIIKNNKNTEI